MITNEEITKHIIDEISSLNNQKHDIEKLHDNLVQRNNTLLSEISIAISEQESLMSEKKDLNFILEHNIAHLSESDLASALDRNSIIEEQQNSNEARIIKLSKEKEEISFTLESLNSSIHKIDVQLISLNNLIQEENNKSSLQKKPELILSKKRVDEKEFKQEIDFKEDDELFRIAADNKVLDITSYKAFGFDLARISNTGIFSGAYSNDFALGLPKNIPIFSTYSPDASMQIPVAISLKASQDINHLSPKIKDMVKSMGINASNLHLGLCVQSTSSQIANDQSANTMLILRPHAILAPDANAGNNIQGAVNAGLNLDKSLKFNGLISNPVSIHDNILSPDNKGDANTVSKEANQSFYSLISCNGNYYLTLHVITSHEDAIRLGNRIAANSENQSAALNEAANFLQRRFGLWDDVEGIIASSNIANVLAGKKRAPAFS